jgi:CubicO group peptidase (beta-lactamase class C family)
MRTHLLAASLLVFSSLAGAVELHWPQAPAASVSELVHQHTAILMDAHLISGAAVAVVHGDTTESFYLGRLSASDERTPETATLFEIGSITKTFTAALLAQMVAAGEVTLETPVSELLPAEMSVPRFENTPIRLWELASHVSGLPRLPGNLNIRRTPDDPYAAYRIEDLAAFLNSHKLRRVPGAEYEYSNLGFALLGTALAHAQKQNYATLLRERILVPLALGEIYLDATTPELAARMAPPQTPGKNGPQPGHRWNLGIFAPAGGIVASLDAMVNYLRVNLRPEDTALAEAAKLLYTPRFTTGPGREVALGWHRMRSEKTGLNLLWHNGETGGYCSFIGFMPERIAGLVILCNTAASKHVDEAAFRMIAGLGTLLP